MTQEQLALLVGSLLSLAFSYVPVLKDKFEALEPRAKQLWNLGIMAVLVVGAFVLSCFGFAEYYTCDVGGGLQALMLLLTALLGNQGTYLGTRYLKRKNGAA